MGETKYAFFENKIVPIGEAKISVMAHAFNYGTACFEGIRAYWNEEREELYVLKMREHYERLLNSCRIIRIALPYDLEALSKITIDLLHKEGFREDTYIRPIAYKSTPGIGVRLHDLGDALTIWTTPFGRYIEREEGAKAGVSSWRRVNDNAIPARAKITGSYINSALIKTDAILNGFDEAIVLSEDGHISEGSAENLFILRDGILITPPVTADILEGITRAVVIEIAEKEMGIETIERPIDRTELYLADEAFFCGTGVQIAAIVSIDHRPVGKGEIGPMVRQLRESYNQIVRGKNHKYMRWLSPVYTEESALKKRKLAAT
jgi:branched-chain amino acid aminotransferase